MVPAARRPRSPPVLSGFVTILSITNESDTTISDGLKTNANEICAGFSTITGMEATNTYQIPYPENFLSPTKGTSPLNEKGGYTGPKAGSRGKPS